MASIAFVILSKTTCIKTNLINYRQIDLNKSEVCMAGVERLLRFRRNLRKKKDLGPEFYCPVGEDGSTGVCGSNSGRELWEEISIFRKVSHT